MSLHQQSELKKAILELPQQEKDKLLIRLVGKDKMLMKQLHFQLLEDESDLEERTDAAHRQLIRLIDHMTRHIVNENHRGQADELMKALKYGSGIVNEHATTTKDKMSELRLRLFLLTQSFANFDRLFQRHPYGWNERLLKYQTGRIKYVLGKYDKLHEDLQFEFRDELNGALAFAYRSGMRNEMEVWGLPNEV